MEQYTSLLMFGALAVFFYLLIIRPQMKRQKEHNELMGSLQAGDRVVTVGGIFGTLRSVGEDSVQLEIATGTILELAKTAIAKKIEA